METTHKPIIRTQASLFELLPPTDPNSEGYKMAMAGEPAELRIELNIKEADGTERQVFLTNRVN